MERREDRREREKRKEGWRKEGYWSNVGRERETMETRVANRLRSGHLGILGLSDGLLWNSSNTRGILKRVE